MGLNCYSGVGGTTYSSNWNSVFLLNVFSKIKKERNKY